MHNRPNDHRHNQIADALTGAGYLITAGILLTAPGRWCQRVIRRRQLARKVVGRVA